MAKFVPGQNGIINLIVTGHEYLTPDQLFSISRIDFANFTRIIVEFISLRLFERPQNVPRAPTFYGGLQRSLNNLTLPSLIIPLLLSNIRRGVPTLPTAEHFVYYPPAAAHTVF